MAFRRPAVIGATPHECGLLMHKDQGCKGSGTQRDRGMHRELAPKLPSSAGFLQPAGSENLKLKAFEDLFEVGHQTPTDRQLLGHATQSHINLAVSLFDAFQAIKANQAIAMNTEK